MGSVARRRVRGEPLCDRGLRADLRRGALPRPWLRALRAARRARRALAHGAVVDFPVLLVIGLGLGYLRARSGSLYPCIAIHGIFNGVGLLAAAFAGST
ncbi:MAG: CPBP family intramembrane metalloprotease [Chloroflexi bacterium]|nr:MAG: CPBP family intramembrane metalloprotease [Chloroflexota bacterium]